MMQRVIIFIFLIVCLLSVFSLGEKDTYDDDSYDDSYYYPQDREIDRTLYNEEYLDYRDAIINTKNMVFDSNAQNLVTAMGLNLLNLTWEDTGRYLDSSVGPNISDMTIQVGLKDPVTEYFELFLMPIIRFPNYEDLTTDLDPQEFTLLVGNEEGEPLQRISLYEFLQKPLNYLSEPESWPGNGDQSLLAERDLKVLVSAQACFLPVPEGDKAIFNPVIFNYQSYQGDPAVLTILATREGTSVTIIDNARDAYSDGFMWGQRLFFNRDGERASLTGERISDFKENNSQNNAENTTQAPTTPGDSEGALNMVLLIQVPLIQKYPLYDNFAVTEEDGAYLEMESSEPMVRSDMEAAVIGSGEAEGPFTEIDGIEIERDPNFPVRVTVQFYLATATGQMTQDDVDSIYEQINAVFEQGDYISSLVTGGGTTGRITEYAGAKIQPADWWERFWERYEDNTGINRRDAVSNLKNLLGTGYMREPVTDLYLRDLLRDGQ